MRLLLDTHLLLWAVGQSSRLPSEARRLIADPANEIYCSSASLWEIAIKLGLRRKDFQLDLGELRRALADMGVIELPVTGAHAERLLDLPSVHKDPFDRILVAQALAEPLLLLTNDGYMRAYGDLVRVLL